MQDYYKKTNVLSNTQSNVPHKIEESHDANFSYPNQYSSSKIGLNGASKSISHRSLMQLQRDYGNHYVQRVIEVARKSEEKADVNEEIEEKINKSRGGGQALDNQTKAKIGSAFNADFSSVRVHTNTEADLLNRSINAKAFTTGQDIFFKQGEYNPGSSSGNELLAHELTHVIQQNPGKIQNKQDDDNAYTSCSYPLNRSIQFKLSIANPGDAYEQEADRMAQAYTNWEQQGFSRANNVDETLNRKSLNMEEQ